jgi:RimJ/RimL family protein N-acetyltransferase
VIFDDPKRCWEYFKKKNQVNQDWGAFTALGWEVNGELKAAVLYERCNGRSVTLHVAGEGLWCNREFLYSVFAYPFLQLKVNKCLGFVDTENKKALNTELSMGFVIEHIIKDAGEKGDLACISMTMENCKFLNGATR